MADPNKEASWRRWAAGAQEQLSRLEEAASALRRAVESVSPGIAGGPDDAASEVAESAAAITTWLHGSKAPRGLGKAEGELAAAAGVYRNVAVAYGSLSDADPSQYEARVAACRKLLGQGAEHVELFDQLIRKKLRTP